MSKDEKMSMLQNREQLLHRLTDVVDAYGADHYRWPAEDRNALRDLLAADPQAQQLYADAALMDQMLDFSNQSSEPSAGAMKQLSDRIMSKLDQECIDRQALPAAAEVIMFPVSQMNRQRTLQAKSAVKSSDVSHWVLRASLVASLMLGIFVGATGYLEQAANSVTALAGLDLNLEINLLIDDGLATSEEEFL